MPAFFGFVVLSVCVFLTLCVSDGLVFLRVLLYLFGMPLVILGLSLLHCSVLMLLLLLHVLVACCLCGLLGCLFAGTLSGGRLGIANTEGSIYLLVFL